MAEEEEWLSINGADLSVASASTVSDFEESETVEQLALDSSALLLTELMMAERRGWEAWRTLNQLLALPAHGVDGGSVHRGDAAPT